MGLHEFNMNRENSLIWFVESINWLICLYKCMVIPSNNKDTFSLVKGLLICLSTRQPKAMLNELVLLVG